MSLTIRVILALCTFGICCETVVGQDGGSGASTYPIKQQPGIWPPEAPHVTYYTPPAGYPLATEYFYALQDIYNPAPAVVYLDWMEVHAIVNGKDEIVVSNDYGTGPGQQNWITGNLTQRSDMLTEIPGFIASGWTTDAVMMQPSDNPSVAYSAWNDVPGRVPAGASDVYVEARMLVTGSAVAQIGLDYWNTDLTNNVNGSYGGFQIFANPNWQIVTLGHPTTVPGDVNFDGVVNGLDTAEVATNWLQIGINPPGDANGDGVVNGLDLATVASHWLQHTGGGTGTSVPEPATFLLGALGFALLWWRNR